MTACEVYPGIYVGDLTAAHFWTGPKLAVRDQPADYLFRSQRDKQVHFVYGRPPKEIYESAAVWLDDMVPQGPVLVHCSGGLHRSAAVVVYWLVTRKGMDVDSAYSLLTYYRPEIEPRPHWLTSSTIEGEK